MDGLERLLAGRLLLEAPATSCRPRPRWWARLCWGHRHHCRWCSWRDAAEHVFQAAAVEGCEDRVGCFLVEFLLGLGLHKLPLENPRLSRGKQRLAGPRPELVVN